MQARTGLCICAVSTALLALTAIPAGAGSIEVIKRYDLAQVLGTVDPDYRIPAITHDGTHLWLINASGDRLLAIDPEDGMLVESHPLVGHDAVQPAGMAFDGEWLWLLDRAGHELLRLDRQGVVDNATSLRHLEGEPFGVDFRPGADGPGAVYVAIRGIGQLPDRLLGYVLRKGGLVMNREELMVIQGGSGLVSTTLSGAPYLLISARRGDERLPIGDVPAPYPDEGLRRFESPLPDDSIPRGGMDHASSHRLILFQSAKGEFVQEVHAPGLPADDLAASGATLFYPSGTVVTVVTLLDHYDLEYGPCVIRDVRYVRREFYSDLTAGALTFAVPYDATFGPPEPQLYVDATGGYEAQELLDWLSMDPADGIRFTETTSVGSSRLARQGVHFPFAADRAPYGHFKLRMRLCSARYNVRPARVLSGDFIPPEVREMYTYDGDGDGFGDDNPATCVDDHFQLDSSVLHDHLVASGATLETNLYWKAKRIHAYVISRHVYEGADKHWSNPNSNPVQKLESPYSTCSSSAFMVAALAREAGIPARIVGTSAQRSGALLPGDLYRDEAFHRWAQVYLPGYGWVRVDSTPGGPGDVGFADANGDGDYDECDLCTTEAQCSSKYDRTYDDCDIVAPFVNLNDIDGDDTVDGDDVRTIGVGFYTNVHINRRYHQGITADNMIMITAAGVPDIYLDRQYHSAPVGKVGNACDPEMRYGSSRIRFVEWSNPMHVLRVIVTAADPSASDRKLVEWETEGPFQPEDLVRIDLYELLEGEKDPRYRFIRSLARDVPALKGGHTVELGELPHEGDFVVVVTRQGGPFKDRLTRLPRADWETFGASDVLPN